MDRSFPFSRVVITGGCGYVGRQLANALRAAHPSIEIVLFDLNATMAGNPGFEVVRGDVCDAGSICAATEGAGAVVHAAAAGMMGTANLPAFDDVTERVNVGGTRNVVEACLRNGVRALVFTSTVNVAFFGREVIGGTECEDRASSDYVDAYSRSKRAAEDLILSADNKNGTLRTCVLRFGGIYGPGESAMQDRIVNSVNRGAFGMFSVIRPEVEIDYLHVDNANQALRKALLKLSRIEPAVAGRCFYITDGHPTSGLFLVSAFNTAITGEEDYRAELKQFIAG